MSGLNALLFFLRPMRRRPGWLLAGFLAMLAGTLCAIGLMSVAGWYLGAASLTGAGLAGAGLAAGGAVIAGLSPAWAIRIFALGRTGFRYLERIWTHEATFRLLADLRVWFFRQALPLAPGRLSLFRGGDLLSRIMDDIDALDTLYLRVLAPTLMAVLAGFAGVLLISTQSLPLALVIALLLFIAGTALPLASAWLGNRAGKRLPETLADMRILGVDTVRGLAEIRLFGAVSQQRAAFAEVSDRLHQDQQRMKLLSGLAQAALGLCSQLALVAALILGIAGLEEGSLTAPMVILLSLGSLALFEIAAPLPTAWQYLGKTGKAAERLLDITNTPPAVTEPASPSPCPDRFALSVEDVSFAWQKSAAGDENARKALDNLSFSLQEGEKLAILGRSGSGKSTLASLLLRFRDPDEGRILLGGTDIRDLAQADLHRHFAWLSQRTELFTGTVRENLLIGRGDADDQALWKALESARLEEVIGKLPGALDGWVGEGGAGLSGGERRRLGLARAFLRDAPVLLLDEPTEGLDRDAELLVLESLDRLMSGRTVIMITHRLRDLKRMDRVLLLDNGQCLAEGPAESLMTREGPLAELLARHEDMADLMQS